MAPGLHGIRSPEKFISAIFTSSDLGIIKNSRVNFT